MSIKTFIEQISSEEEDLLIEQADNADHVETALNASNAASEVNELAANSLRSIDVAESLESIRETLEHMTTISPASYKLAGIGVGMALAGTGIQSSRFIPAFESNDPALALEGITEKISQIISGIGNTFKKMIDSFKKFLGNMAFACRSTLGQVKKLREQIAALKSNGKKHANNVSVKYRDVLSTDKTFNKMDQLLKEHGNVYKLSDDAFGTIVDNARVLDGEYSQLRLLVDLAQVEKTSMFFFNNTKDLSNSLAKSASFHKKRVFNGAEEYITDTYLCSTFFVIKQPDSKQYNFTDYQDVKKCGHLYSFNAELTLDDNSDSQVTFDTVKIEHLTSLLDTVYKMNTGLCKYYDQFDQLLNNAGAIFLGQHTAANNAAVVAEAVAQATIYSYKMMIVNNNFIFNSICYIGGLDDKFSRETIYMVKEILAKGTWE